MKTSTMLSCSRNLLIGGLFVLGQIGSFANESSLNSKTNSLLASVDSVADSGATSLDSIAKGVLNPNSIPVQFENDAVYPWVVNGSHAESGNRGVENSTSSLKMNYNSEYKTEVTFTWWRNNPDYHDLSAYVDGSYYGKMEQYDTQQVRFYLSKGTHIIELKDSISSVSSWSGDQYGCFSDLCVKEILPLETAVLSAKSKPLTFTNDEKYPWTIEDGCIQNSNYGREKSSSRFSTTFTIDKPHKFSFDAFVGGVDGWSGYEEYHKLQFFINDVCYDIYDNLNYFRSSKVLLEPGTYKMEWVDTLSNDYRDFRTKIKNIELSENWVDVELASAGTLGVEVLYKVNVLDDVELLKVRGPLNSADWDNIKQMTNLIGLDLTEAKFNDVPNNAFGGLNWLSNVKLPEGITAIGDAAFKTTQIDHITIPSTVKTIGESAFEETRLEQISFAENASLKSIHAYAFKDCKRLKAFIMPNSVTELEKYTYNGYSSRIFFGCDALEKLVFSDSLTLLPEQVCYECINLKELHLPKSLQKIQREAFYNNSKLSKVKFPESLKSIDYRAFYECALDSVCLPVKLTYLGERAFEDCNQLTYIELPSYIGSYNNNFSYCSSIKKVVCQSATPPTIEQDPFYRSQSKSNMTLVVPSFAVVNYKLDQYWYQFGEIVEGDDIDYWKVTSDLSLTNNRRMNGKPFIDLFYGGKLSVGGNAPFEASQMNFYVNTKDPCRLLNTCEAMSADSVNTYYSVEHDKWYFFTPLHDVLVKDIQVSDDASFVFRYFNAKNRADLGAGSSWQNVVDEKLLAGQGYIFHCNKNCVITFPAKKEVHAQVFSVQERVLPLVTNESSVAANKNWNYVGNPYPCCFDIYYMDFTAPITVWTGSTYRALSVVDDNYVLDPMQSFFVQKPDAVESIKFNPAGKQISRSVNRASYVSAKSSRSNVERYVYNLTIGNEQVDDRTRVVLNENRSLDYEMECDASKFISMNAEVAQIYTLDEDNNKLSINERPMSDGLVKFGFYVSEPGKYTIKSERADGEIYIVDQEAQKEVDLSKDQYEFEVTTSGWNEDRFVLRLKPQHVTGVSAIEKASADIKVVGHNIMVSASETSVVGIYNLSGKLLDESKGTLNTNVGAGVYVIVVDGVSYKVVVS